MTIFSTATGFMGDSISAEFDGFTVTANLHFDDAAGKPWEESDGHGPVSELTTRDKRPGELVLSEGRIAKRFYDYQEACRIARADGWGCKGGQLEGETARAYAARAARADFDRLRAWCDDEWHYVGVAVTVKREGVQLVGDYDFALWCIENDSGDYLIEVANQLAPDAIDAAKFVAAKLAASVEA